MSQRLLLNWALSAFACLLLAAPASAQAAPAADDSNAGGTKAQALKWIDRFAAEQVLFGAGDVERFREKVVKMTAAEAAAWWDKSASHRELFDSEDWQETRRWLQEFLKVQAIYSDEQVEYFQSEAFTKAEGSSRSLKDVMDEITTKRKRLAAEHRSFEQTRQQQLEYYQAYRQEQVATREAAMRAAAQQSASRPQPQKPVVKREDPRRTPPLVSSLDVARWSVMRNFWPRP
jgi:hypothetical protein